MPTTTEVYKHMLNGETIHYTENYVFARKAVPTDILLPDKHGTLVDSKGVSYGNFEDPQFVRKTTSWNWLEPDILHKANLLDDPSIFSTPCSGVISIQDIRNEFYGGGGPSNLYELGANILGRPQGQAVSLTEFYCKSSIQPINDQRIFQFSVHMVTSNIVIYRPYDGYYVKADSPEGYINWGTPQVTFNPASYNGFSSRLVYEAGGYSALYIQQELFKDTWATVNSFCEHVQQGDGDVQCGVYTTATL